MTPLLYDTFSTIEVYALTVRALSAARLAGVPNLNLILYMRGRDRGEPLRVAGDSTLEVNEGNMSM